MKNRSNLKTRRQQHEKRVAAWQSLSQAQQLAELDARHGVGLGATKQRKRLA